MPVPERVDSMVPDVLEPDPSAAGIVEVAGIRRSGARGGEDDDEDS